jgi:hypothetical protein
MNDLSIGKDGRFNLLLRFHRSNRDRLDKLNPDFLRFKLGQPLHRVERRHASQPRGLQVIRALLPWFRNGRDSILIHLLSRLWNSDFHRIFIRTPDQNHMQLPLQVLASKVAAILLPITGIPVLREGNVIHPAPFSWPI